MSLGCQPNSQLPTSEQRYRSCRCLLLFLIAAGILVLATHWPTLSSKALLFDDDQYLVENRLVQNPSLSSAKQFLTEILNPSTVRGYYQPLTMISLMLDVAAGGSPANLKPFHLTSLCLHIANTLLVIVFLYLLFDRSLPAAIIGLLYGLHPVTIESVAWIAQRKTVLATFFALWSLISYLCYVRKNHRWYLVLCAFTYILSLLAKPTIVAMPLLMLLLDFWPLRRLTKKAILEKIPLFLIAVVAAAVTFSSQKATATVILPAQAGLARVLLILCHNIIFYLYNLSWPMNLSWYYPFPEPFNFSHPWLITCVIGACVLVAVLLASLRWTRCLFISWLFFFAAIFPTLGLIGFHPMIAADRHLYFPMIGLLLPLAWLFSRLWSSRSLILKAAPSTRRAVLIALVTIVSASQLALTRNYLAYWTNTEKVYKYMLRSAPNVGMLHNNLANVLKDSGKLSQAIAHFNRALDLKPNSPEIHNNLGNALSKLDRLDQAIDHYKEAIKIKPNLPSAHYNLATALAKQGNFDEAIAEYRITLDLKPDFVDALSNLGFELAKQGDFQQAVEYYNEALGYAPQNVIARGRLGLALVNLGRTNEAIQQFQIVLQARPNDAEMHFNLGYLLAEHDQTDQAIAEYRHALQIDPNFTKAHNYLEAALAEQKNP